MIARGLDRVGGLWIASGVTGIPTRIVRWLVFWFRSWRRFGNAELICEHARLLGHPPVQFGAVFFDKGAVFREGDSDLACRHAVRCVEILLNLLMRGVVGVANIALAQLD
jgi:hypothetical protein